MTSLRGPGERNFNAVSHKLFARVGLWDTALKFLSPGPRSDVTDHLDDTIAKFRIGVKFAPRYNNRGELPPG